MVHVPTRRKTLTCPECRRRVTGLLTPAHFHRTAAAMVCLRCYERHDRGDPYIRYRDWLALQRTLERAAPATPTTPRPE